MTAIHHRCTPLFVCMNIFWYVRKSMDRRRQQQQRGRGRRRDLVLANSIESNSADNLPDRALTHTRAHITSNGRWLLFLYEILIRKQRRAFVCMHKISTIAWLRVRCVSVQNRRKKANDNGFRSIARRVVYASSKYTCTHTTLSTYKNVKYWVWPKYYDCMENSTQQQKNQLSQAENAENFRFFFSLFSKSEHLTFCFNKFDKMLPILLRSFKKISISGKFIDAIYDTIVYP